MAAVSKRKFLYRVTAYRDKTFGAAGEYAESRCYQTKRAALHRAAIWRNGLPGDEFAPALEPANRVTVERSAEVTGWEPFEVTA